MDSAIHRINHYPLDSAIGLPAIHWIMIYTVDSAILLLNNWAWQPVWQTFDREGERSAPGTLTYRTSANSATQAIFHIWGLFEFIQSEGPLYETRGDARHVV